MLKIISIAALSIGLATSAMAAGGSAGGAGGGANGAGVHSGTDLGGTSNSILAPDNTTTGSINGTSGAMGSNGTDGTHRMKSQNCNGSASRTTTGTMSANPSTSSDAAGSGSCQ